MENTIKSTLVCPHCNGEIIIESPAPQRRGQLAGIALEDMSVEQLKREAINAKSVLYKAQKRGASAETIAKNQARVDAVVAALAATKPVMTEVVAEAVAEVVAEGEPAAE